MQLNGKLSFNSNEEIRYHLSFTETDHYKDENILATLTGIAVSEIYHIQEAIDAYTGLSNIKSFNILLHILQEKAKNKP